MTAPNQEPDPDKFGLRTALPRLPGVSRTTAVDLAQRMQTLYADAETRLLTDMSRRLAAGMDSPRWALDKLEQTARLRAHAERLLAQLAADTTYETHYALVSAYMRGGVEATRALAQLGMNFPAHPDPRLQALLDGPKSRLTVGLAELAHAFPAIAGIMRVAASLALRITGTHLPVLRWAEDAYRQVIAAGALTDVLGGLATRRRASQVAWEKLLSDGITGFTDRAGRSWNLATYIEMATRTGVAQAAVEGHMDRLADIGLNLVMVSNAPQECARCRPWEGKILERDGQEGRHLIIIENVKTGRFQRIEVAGSVDEAIRAGLMHPNCRHRFVLYVHGATKIPTDTEDPEGDAARQRLRHLERNVRKEKLKAVAAIDPAARTVHERKARAWQDKIRAHVAETEHLGIFRHREREQINLGHGPHDTRITGPRPTPRPTPPTGLQPAEGMPGRVILPPGGEAPDPPGTVGHSAWGAPLDAMGRPIDSQGRPLEFKPPTPAEPGRFDWLDDDDDGAFQAKIAKAAAAAEAKDRQREAALRVPPPNDGPKLGMLIPRTAREAHDKETQTRDAIMRRLNGGYGDLRVKVTEVGVDTDHIRLRAQILDDRGMPVGNTVRDIRRGRKDGKEVLWVYHALLKLDKRVQGQGFAEKWNGHLEAWYRQSGLSYVKVTANIDVGGYTWARQGFDFADALGPMLIGKNLQRFVEQDYGFDAEQIDAVRGILRRLELGHGHPDFPTAHEVSQVGRKDGMGKTDRWPGKQAMLGSTWSGVKWLK